MPISVAKQLAMSPSSLYWLIAIAGLAVTPPNGLALNSHASIGDQSHGQEIVVSALSPSKCPELPGADDVGAFAAKQDKRFIIFGEKHGTEEIPTLFGDFVCRISASRPVTVVLEFPSSDQHLLDSFMSSENGSEDLLKMPSWHSKFQDGRTSESMFRLFLYLRRLARIRGDLEVRFSQPSSLKSLIGNDYYNLAMAFEWAKIVDSRPTAINIVLVGSAHADQRFDLASAFIPAAAHLPSKDVITLEPELSGGQAWNCALPSLQCGPHDVEKSGRKPRFVGLLSSSSEGRGGTYSIGIEFSSSAPYLIDRGSDARQH